MKCSEIEVREFVATCNFVQEYHLKDSVSTLSRRGSCVLLWSALLLWRVLRIARIFVQANTPKARGIEGESSGW